MPTKIATVTASRTKPSCCSASIPATPPANQPPADLAGASARSAEFAKFLAGYAGVLRTGCAPTGAPSRVLRRWVRNPVDAFILVNKKTRGLVPRVEASRPVLLRRIYLDLLGLSPTPQEQKLSSRFLRGLPTKGRGPFVGRSALRRALGPPLDGRLALLAIGQAGPMAAKSATEATHRGVGAIGSWIH
jgi:hypothetical protein